MRSQPAPLRPAEDQGAPPPPARLSAVIRLFRFRLAKRGSLCQDGCLRAGIWQFHFAKWIWAKSEHSCTAARKKIPSAPSGGNRTVAAAHSWKEKVRSGLPSPSLQDAPPRAPLEGSQVPSGQMLRGKPGWEHADASWTQRAFLPAGKEAEARSTGGPRPDTTPSKARGWRGSGEACPLCPSASWALRQLA